MIVDETRACSEELKASLVSCGFQVVSVTTYREAIRALHRANETFDFAIINIAESPRKGLEWLRQTAAIRLRLDSLSGHTLCVAPTFLDPQIELEIEELGGTVVYEQQVRFSAA